ncbi:MAG: DNA mismatch repair protein MutS [Oscillospiraceae bacterium]|nr:DNA mismatch repair protein MutS [Oscillospiraceae bacterium]
MFNIDREQLQPMMRQYYDIKKEYPHAILFYRLGDFYEMFFDDALEASAFLGLTLTGRACGLPDKAPMCGVPYHSADTYINRLVEGGYKVAICEQLEEAVGGKLVERDVTRVITAGTVTNENSLENKANNYLVSVYSFGSVASVSAVDVTTGILFCTEIWGARGFSELLSEVLRYNPKEVLIDSAFPQKDKFIAQIKLNSEASITELESKYYDSFTAEMLISKQFGTKNEKFGQGAVCVVGSILRYLDDTQRTSLPHISEIHFYSSSEFMQVDYSSRKNLELTETLRDGKRKGSLLWVLDRTVTSMGGRMLRSWLDKPLIDGHKIGLRQEAVREFYNNLMLTDDFRDLAKTIGDIERLNSKIVTKRANGRDCLAIANSIQYLPQLLKLLEPLDSEIARGIKAEFDDLADLYKLISDSIEEDAPAVVREGGIFKKGYNPQLDIYRKAAEDSTGWLAELEERERERTGIEKLKVAYNSVAGFYIEVSKVNSKFVPEDYIRKATLTNAERYITPELKEIEGTVLGAKDKRERLEYELFLEFLTQLSNYQSRVLKMASEIASLDCLAALAKVAYENNFTCPKICDNNIIEIKNGRHPIVEKYVPTGGFIANDTYLDSEQRINIITGPNMAGKSTYMRQVALIIILAQIGSFVPAESASIGIVDKIFTRVGASDDLASGQSTFMVEMTEVANILENATEKSFVILDEIGRGTSTYDGLAIAQAVVEHIAREIRAKTIFATHYHELTVLEGSVDGVKNYCVSAEKRDGEIIFLRKVVPGGADESFGIEVAKLAGVSAEVVERARMIVEELEGENAID